MANKWRNRQLRKRELLGQLIRKSVIAEKADTFNWFSGQRRQIIERVLSNLGLLKQYQEARELILYMGVE